MNFIFKSSAQTGKIFIISGPSGVGKKTLLNRLFQKKDLNLAFSISHTSRPKREKEINGKDYFFISKPEFLSEIKRGSFLEYAEFFDNYYGTNKRHVDEVINEGKNIVLEIEVTGFHQVIQKIPNLISIFIYPPSIEDLKTRLLNRNTENLEKIWLRLQKAETELTEMHHFKYRILNDNVDKAYKELEKIFVDEIHGKK